MTRFNSRQVQFYHENGYVAGPRVLSDEQIERLRRRFDDMIEGRVDSYPEALRGQIPQGVGNLRGVKMVNVLRHDHVFRNVLLGNQLISNLAHDLLSGPVRFWQDQAIMKAPHDTDTGLAWHQDFVYNDQIEPAEWLTCWIAIDDAHEANGCMKLIPKSHRWPISYNRDEVDPDDMEWLLRRPDIPDEADLTPVSVEVKAGHCHFHHCKTFHGSYGNYTDNPRRSYVPILMPGNTVKAKEDWNPGRQASSDSFAIGQLIDGPDFPELMCPDLAKEEAKEA